MTTFELANYPRGATTWEVYLDGIPIQKKTSQQQLVVDKDKGELIITLYQETTPIWRWAGQLPRGITNTQRVQVNPKEGKICIIESVPQVRSKTITDVLKVGAVLGVVALVLGSSKTR